MWRIYLLLVLSVGHTEYLFLDLRCRVPWADDQDTAGEEGDPQHDVNEDIVGEEVLEEDKVPDLEPKDDVDVRVASVQGHGAGGELHQGQRTDEQEPGVEEEGVHHCAMELHWEDLDDEGDPQPDSEVALDTAPQQVEGEDSKAHDSEERKTS